MSRELRIPAYPNVEVKSLLDGRLTRRGLFASTLAIAGSGLGGFVVTAPRADAAGTVTLNQFLSLSSLLTGVSGLDPDLGKTYLGGLELKPGSSAALMALVQRSGIASPTPPKTLAQLTATGVFSDQAMRGAVDKILEYWFTGTYDTPSGPRVATYAGALAWTTSYTKAMSLCGGVTGYWAERPKT